MSAFTSTSMVILETQAHLQSVVHSHHSYKQDMHLDPSMFPMTIAFIIQQSCPLLDDS